MSTQATLTDEQREPMRVHATLAASGEAALAARETFARACAEDWSDVGPNYLRWIAAGVACDQAVVVAAAVLDPRSPLSQPPGASVPPLDQALSWGMGEAVRSTVAEADG